MYYVYSLKCKKGHYIGCSNDLKERLDRHKKGYVKATKNNLSVKLVFYIAFEDELKLLNLKNI